jgi:hypothetical protein
MKKEEIKNKKLLHLIKKLEIAIKLRELKDLLQEYERNKIK